MEVGQEIRRLREARAWSQAKLAAAADMGVSGVSQIETGIRNPSAVTLVKLAQALDVEVADLFPKEPARIDPGVKELRWVAHELDPDTPLDEAVERLSLAGEKVLGVALSQVSGEPFDVSPDDSGWLNDPASTTPAFRAALQFVQKTGSDVQTVFERVKDAFLLHRIEAGRESQRAAEDAGEERTA